MLSGRQMRKFNEGIFDGACSWMLGAGGFEFGHLKSEFWHLKSEVWHLKSEFWHLKTEFWPHALTPQSAQRAAKENIAKSKRLSVTVSVGTPPFSYGIA